MPKYVLLLQNFSYFPLKLSYYGVIWTLSISFSQFHQNNSVIQYTTKFENDQKQLKFLDITISNNGTNSYDLKIFRKPHIMDVQNNLTQTWHLIFPFQFSKVPYIEQKMVMKKKLWKRYQKIFKRTSKPPVTNKERIIVKISRKQSNFHGHLLLNPKGKL